MASCHTKESIKKVYGDKGCFGRSNRAFLHLNEIQDGIMRKDMATASLNIDLDASGKMIGLEVLDAADRYSLTDIFNISTENLILEKALLQKVI